MFDALKNRYVRYRSFIRTWAAIILGLALVCLLVARPLYTRAIKGLGRCYNLQRQYVQARSLISKMPAIEAENAKLAYLGWYGADGGPQNQMQSKLLASLLETAQKSQIEFLSLRPFAMREEGDYYLLPFKLELRSRYHSIGKFLSLLDQGTCLVKADGIRMQGDKSGAPMISAEVEARAYFLKMRFTGGGLKPRAGRQGADSGFVYKTQNRDPFIPGGATEAMVARNTGPSFRLKGVVWEPNKPLAVIMDAAGVTFMLRQGETMGTDKILAIKENGVTLRRSNGTRYELKTWE